MMKNMNRWFFSICLITTSLGFSNSSDQLCQCSAPMLRCPPMIELKGGYFFYGSSTMRNVYRNGGYELQLSGSYPVWQCLQIYGGVGFLQTKGHSIGGGEATTVWQLPVDLGLKPVFRLTDWLQCYFALGPRYFYFHQYNDSPYVNKTYGKNGIGLFVNTGFNFKFWNSFFFDIFGEYSFEKCTWSGSAANVYGRSVQVGGFTFGAGLGYMF